MRAMPAPIPSSWSLPQTVLARIGSGPGRQRLIAEDGHVVLVLHAMPNADDPTRRLARYFWRSPHGAWRASATPADSTVASLRAHVEAFFERADHFEEEIEQASTAEDWFRLLHELAPFARTARNMAKVLQDLRDHLGPDPDVIGIRDRAVDVERAAELVHQWASQGLEYTIAKTNEEQARLSEYISRSSHRLNLLAAFTLPLTALGSLLGMNLESGLEHAARPWLFYGTGAFCVLLGLVIRYSMPEPPAPFVPVPRRTKRSTVPPRAKS